VVDRQAAFPRSPKRHRHQRSSLSTPAPTCHSLSQTPIPHLPPPSIKVHAVLKNMSRNCGVSSRLIDSPLFNVTELYQQKWEDSPKDDRKRLEKCWGYTDCGDCHRSEGFCGWCPIVSLCFLLLNGNSKEGGRSLFESFGGRKQEVYGFFPSMPLFVIEGLFGVNIPSSCLSRSN